MSYLPFWFRALRALILSVTLTGLIVILCFTYFESYTIGIRRHQVDLEKLHSPINVAVISDIQYFAEHGGKIPLTKVVERINYEKPDLLFLLGDFLGEERSLTPLLTRLSRLDPQIDIISVLGNWDYDPKTVDTSLLVSGLESIGARVLINELIYYQTGKGEIVQIAGLDQAGFKWRYPGWAKLMHRLNRNHSLIAITHFPSAIDEIEAFGYDPDLIIAGDTHGGQIRLPLIDIPLYAPGKYGLLYSAGMYHTKAGPLYVNRGLGLSKQFPFRINNPPELTFFTFY